jgi:hypothetical protein
MPKKSYSCAEYTKYVVFVDKYFTGHVEANPMGEVRSLMLRNDLDRRLVS